VYFWSASRLRNGVEDWREITPQALQDAVKALRKNLAEQAFVDHHIMTNGCRPALRRGLSGQCDGINRLIQEQLGLSALGSVDGGQTEPAVFKCYFELCAAHLAGVLKRTFSDLLDIALAQHAKIILAPVEWAVLQARVLVADQSYTTSLWLKSTCDDGLFPPDDDLHWSSWRAPRWIFMEPFGNRTYDRSKAWEKMDKTESEDVLDAIEDLFNQRLIFSLEKAVGKTHVALAKRLADVVPKAASHAGDSGVGSGRGTGPAKPMSSHLQPDVAKRRTIVKNNPNMKGQGLCTLFDAAEIPLPKGMEVGGWSQAWKTRAYKHALESMISRDRKSK
jgi:hypothetical protein